MKNKREEFINRLKEMTKVQPKNQVMNYYILMTEV